MNKSHQNVTVVIPTRNRSRDLERCIKALLKQSVSNFRILVIDNGSSDKTLEVLSRYPVKLLRYSTGNLTHIFNVGWEFSEDEIVAYLNDDSEPTPKWLEAAVTSLADSTVHCVGGPTIDLKPREIARSLRNNKKTVVRIFRNFYEKVILGKSLAEIGYFSPVGAYSIGGWLPESKNINGVKDVDFVTITNMAIKKASLEKLGGFDENLRYNHADGDLFVRMKRAQYRVLFNPKMVVWHRVNPTRRVRMPFYLGRDFAYFLLKDFAPKSFNNLIRMLLYIATLNVFWIYKAGSTGSFEPLKGIVGFVSGLRCLLKVRCANDFQK